MQISVPRPRASRSLLATTLALSAVVVATLPAAAFNSNWTKPKPVFKYSPAPLYTMATDVAGKVHIATERGTGGVWYVTNASGSWQSCQLSADNDRWPAVAVDGAVVHIAFARQAEGDKGVFTASSDQPAGAAGCGWAVTKRYVGSANNTAMRAYGGKLSIAFRTGDRKLKFRKGLAGATDWAPAEVIDGKCCTSPVALELTSSGSPRVAFGDGTSRAEGLKFAVRTAKGWKKSKVHGGRIKHVAMTLNKLPGLFGEPPSNDPSIVFVVKKRGSLLATKGAGWFYRDLGKAFGPPAISNSSNVTQVIVVKNGSLILLRASGNIWFATKLSGAGTDTRPQYDGSNLTFSRKAGTKGVFYSRPK